MVRHKRSPIQSAPQNGDCSWNGTLFLRPAVVDDSQDFEEPTMDVVSPSESSSPIPLGSSSNADRRNMNWDQRRGGNAHPLHGHPGLEPFNDMQILIIDAIAEVGEPASFDQILQSVSSRWRGIKIRRRDGTPYTTDCRRAIQANLRTNPHQVSLFVRAVNSDGTVAWRFSQSIEEAEEAKLKSKSEKVKETKPEETKRTDGMQLDGTDTSSDNDSHPMTPDPQEYTRSLRPVRAARHSGALDDFLVQGEIFDDETFMDGVSTASGNGMRGYAAMGRPRRDSASSNSYTESSSAYSLDSSFLRNKQQIRREHMDESDIPPAKRFSVGSLDAELLAGAVLSEAAAMGSSNSNGSIQNQNPLFVQSHHHNGSFSSPSSSSYSSSSISGAHTMEWMKVSPSQRNPSMNTSSSSAAPSPPPSAINMPAVLNLNSLMTGHDMGAVGAVGAVGADQHQNHPTPQNHQNHLQNHQALQNHQQQRFQGAWFPPALFGYFQPQAAAAAAASYSAAASSPNGSSAVPQFLPHQMSLAHEKAQQVVSDGGNSDYGAWSDRSRLSLSSSRTSTSTLPDPSPRTPLGTPHGLSSGGGAGMTGGAGISAGVHPAFAALPPNFHLYSASPNQMNGITSSPVGSMSLSNHLHNSTSTNHGANHQDTTPSFQEGTLSH